MLNALLEEVLLDSAQLERYQLPPPSEPESSKPRPEDPEYADWLLGFRKTRYQYLPNATKG